MEIAHYPSKLIPNVAMSLYNSTLSAPVYIQRPLYCIITNEGNPRLPKRLTL